MSKELRIVAVTKSELIIAIEQNTYWRDELVPLPKSKAAWIVANDRIGADDYCGVFGFENDIMVSFIFMFPDIMRIHKTKNQKVYWMLLWWVNKKYENTVLGTYIYNEAVNLTGNKVLIKSYAEKVHDFYKKQPFDVIASRVRYTIFFSLDASILIGRFPFLKSVKFFIKKAGAFSSVVVRFLNKRIIKKSLKGINYEYISQLDSQTWEFMEPLCENDLILKTRDYVNWQIHPLQYTDLLVNKRFKHHSLQVGYGNNIKIYNVKILKKKELIGFMSFVINSKECNVKYFLVEKEENYNLCVNALIEQMIQTKINFMFTDDAALAKEIKKKYKTIYTYEVIKNGLAHKDMNIQLDETNFYNRDGHFY